MSPECWPPGHVPDAVSGPLSGNFRVKPAGWSHINGPCCGDCSAVICIIVVCIRHFLQRIKWIMLDVFRLQSNTLFLAFRFLCLKSHHY